MLVFTFLTILINLIACMEGFRINSRLNMRNRGPSLYDSAVNSGSSSGNNEPKLRSEEWAKLRGLEPGYGGVWPGDPNAPKFNVTIISKSAQETFSVMVPNDRYIYFYFEEAGESIY